MTGRRIRTARIETEDDVADAEFVLIAKFRAAFDRNLIQIGLVAATEILKKVTAVALQDLGVVTADGGVVEHDFATGMTSQDASLAAKFQHLADFGSLKDFEEGHERTRSDCGSEEEPTSTVP